MKNRNCTIVALALAASLTAIQSLAQSTYEPYTFTTLAGGGGYSTNQAGSATRFWSPISVAVDSEGNVYVADTYNNTIRKVTPARVVTTLGGMPDNIGTAERDRERRAVQQSCRRGRGQRGERLRGGLLLQYDPQRITCAQHPEFRTDLRIPRWPFRI